MPEENTRVQVRIVTHRLTEMDAFYLASLAERLERLNVQGDKTQAVLTVAFPMIYKNERPGK